MLPDFADDSRALFYYRFLLSISDSLATTPQVYDRLLTTVSSDRLPKANTSAKEEVKHGKKEGFCSVNGIHQHRFRA